MKTLETINGFSIVGIRGPILKITFEDEKIPAFMGMITYGMWRLKEHMPHECGPEWLLNRKVWVRHKTRICGEKLYQIRDIVEFL